MASEFTGERVIPGEVGADLWNEHRARYLFAARLCRGKRVLDLGCGAGYGTAEMARTAAFAAGVDVAEEAAACARRLYPDSPASFLAASATAVPFSGGSFNLITAFEVIEHLSEWPALLQEARRLLAPGGQFLVSTPNKSYYESSRGESGPNPFHTHEFEFAEFGDALRAVFPHVSLFIQNHSAAIVFQPIETAAGSELRLEGAAANPEEAHFYLAVCALSPQTGAPTYVYLPSTANLVLERERHVAMLERELATKNQWLERAQQDHQKLLEMFRAQAVELEERNRWAQKLNHEVQQQGARIEQLQGELAAEQASGLETAARYDAKIAELEQDNRVKTEWARQTEERLGREIEEKSRELAECVRLLDERETTIEERTKWAQSLQQQVDELTARQVMIEASRWLRLGRTLGVGPGARTQENTPARKT